MNFSLSQRIRTQEVSEPRLLLVDDIKNVQSPFRRVARKLVPRQILSYLTSGKGWRDVGRVWRVEEHRRRAFCGESPWFDQTQLDIPRGIELHCQRLRQSFDRMLRGPVKRHSRRRGKAGDTGDRYNSSTLPSVSEELHSSLGHVERSPEVGFKHFPSCTFRRSFDLPATSNSPVIDNS